MTALRWILPACVGTGIVASPASAEQFLVRTQLEYRQALKQAHAGDVILLADGEWRNFQILFEGRGTAKMPLTLAAQTKGRVVLTGVSNLRLAGEHLVVSGLVFRDGHAPADEVIAFRRDSKTPASHSRVTEIVIDGFNQPDRHKEDRWVSLYGQFNRVDHSHFAGKANAGVTLAVIRQAGQPLDNRHRIDHNYFGPRPPLGSNGGETIRIGTSEQSLSDSRTVIEDNVFDRCDGEVEIISIKSGANIIRRNTFLQSQGAVVLRHGNGNLVENNVFLGDGKPNTGGVRVINADQIVRGNYMEGLAGKDFSSAITVMNGVPNSAVNRYHQVRGALIENNSLIDVARVTLGAGADAERSAPPLDSRFARNLIVNRDGKDPLRIDADIGGIAFADNALDGPARTAIMKGVAVRTIELERAANGLLYPRDTALAAAGAPRSLAPVTRDQVGASWYPKPARIDAVFGTGKISLLPAGGDLSAAIAGAASGDTIRLAAGRYTVATPLAIDRALTLAGAGPATQLNFVAPTLFQIEQGGNLRLEAIAISGANAPVAQGNAVIRSSAASMTANYRIEIEQSSFTGLDAAAGFDVIATTPSTLAETIAIRASRFDGVSGAVIAAHSETGEQGLYNIEQIDIAQSEFSHVGIIADVHRGGRDESTFGPRFGLTGSQIVASGFASGAVLRLSGVQSTVIADNRFTDSAAVEVVHSVGSPDTRITGNRFARTPMPLIRELHAKGPPRAVLADNMAVN